MTILANFSNPLSLSPRAEARSLSCLCYAQGFSLWLYRADRLKDVMQPGFFDTFARDLVSKRDMILISASDGCSILQISAASSTSVIVKPITL